MSEDDETETMVDRAKWAISIVQEMEVDVTVLVDHFHTALGEVRFPILWPDSRHYAG